MVAYELHPVNLQVINYRDREGGGWRRSALRPVQITIRDQCTPRDCSCYGWFEIYKTNQNSSWKKIPICFYFWYSLNSILANVYDIVYSTNLVMHIQSTTTAAARKLHKKPSAWMATYILSLSKLNKWNQLQTNAPKLKPSNLPVLIEMVG